MLTPPAIVGMKGEEEEAARGRGRAAAHVAADEEAAEDELRNCLAAACASCNSRAASDGLALAESAVRAELLRACAALTICGDDAEAASLRAALASSAARVGDSGRDESCAVDAEDCRNCGGVSGAKRSRCAEREAGVWREDVRRVGTVEAGVASLLRSSLSSPLLRDSGQPARELNPMCGEERAALRTRG